MKTERKRLTREESQQQTREQLLETARQLFVAGGYGGTSIRDIASQAGYSQGAFYSNFASKEALLLQLLQRHMEAEATQLTALAQSDIDTPERVLTALEAWAATLNLEADWCMLSVELQLHAKRSPAFAAEYKNIWDAHQAKIGAVIGSLFQRVARCRRRIKRTGGGPYGDGARAGFAADRHRRRSLRQVDYVVSAQPAVCAGGRLNTEDRNNR